MPTTGHLHIVVNCDIISGMFGFTALAVQIRDFKGQERLAERSRFVLDGKEIKPGFPDLGSKADG